MRLPLLFATLALALSALLPVTAAAAPASGGAEATTRAESVSAAAPTSGASLPEASPVRRAGPGLIALIWAMTLLGALTVAVLLRRNPPAAAEPAQA